MEKETEGERGGRGEGRGERGEGSEGGRRRRGQGDVMGVPIVVQACWGGRGGNTHKTLEHQRFYFIEIFVNKSESCH
jgi:hypothetical protein